MRWLQDPIWTFIEEAPRVRTCLEGIHITQAKKISFAIDNCAAVLPPQDGGTMNSCKQSNLTRLQAGCLIGLRLEIP